MILDLSCNNNYKSGIIDLALNYNVPVATNNHYYINNDVQIIKNNDVDSLRYYFNKTNTISKDFLRKNNLEYNLEIKNAISNMAGI